MLVIFSSPRPTTYSRCRGTPPSRSEAAEVTSGAWFRTALRLDFTLATTLAASTICLPVPVVGAR
jgi:hypothetical protein